jgi:shikimate dehydrogenase
MKLALIGKSLSHSFSKSYFTAKFERENLNASYDNLEFNTESELVEIWPELSSQYNGFNITIPHKKILLPYLDELDIHAERIGAVNCIAIKAGKSYGYNTDYQGFYKSVFKKSFSRNRKALILGNGGASLAVNYAIENLLKMPVDIISRDNSYISWSHIETLDLADYSLIVNSTPIGMFPDVEDCPPLNYASALQDSLFVDLIYNPMITKFLEKSDEQGCMIINGLPRLHSQAGVSWQVWNNLI